MTVVDIDDVNGIKTCDEFKNEFGKENVNYIHCDVTDKDSLEGDMKCSHF